MLRPSIGSLWRSMAAAPKLRRISAAASSEPPRNGEQLQPERERRQGQHRAEESVSEQRRGQRHQRGRRHQRDQHQRRIEAHQGGEGRPRHDRRGDALQHDAEKQIRGPAVETGGMADDAEQKRHRERRPRRRGQHDSRPPHMAQHGRHIDAHEGDREQQKDRFGNIGLQQRAERRHRNADEHQRRNRTGALPPDPSERADGELQGVVQSRTHADLMRHRWHRCKAGRTRRPRRSRLPLPLAREGWGEGPGRLPKHHWRNLTSQPENFCSAQNSGTAPHLPRSAIADASRPRLLKTTAAKGRLWTFPARGRGEHAASFSRRISPSSSPPGLTRWSMMTKRTQKHGVNRSEAAPMHGLPGQARQ
jgi:hypothetical protein